MAREEEEEEEEEDGADYPELYEDNSGFGSSDFM
jgi:hypothetical protein